MSLDFAVDYPCPLRARYPEQHLREWGRLSHLHTIVTTADQSAPGQDKLEWIEKAASQIDQMQTETEICAHCPACLPFEAAGDGEAEAKSPTRCVHPSPASRVGANHARRRDGIRASNSTCRPGKGEFQERP